ncbi:amino acid/amide ABC transporter membrane protein 2, HAAT family [Thalassoporum mexicanum PCC 7367]|uniref:branched-chain amino acid ABC transporter permease n=1 Tax=Thalassoporum mexicanum TaxID=3457544 RepID=UPI00029FAD82|nr:branched-chain amino acid ABC transporter permease [Pseudanabaena sp. PCC 7367]AFY68591.1 amino acid/amide ABC transporter membrane protein 2, HAAT family [Pseudanabaena sp. PCC 7367]
MADFFNAYGFLIVSMAFGAVLGLSVYLPLMAGQLSLATPGFYALGGYIAAIFSTQVFTTEASLFPIPLVLLEIGIAAIAAAVLAIIVGILVLRLRGIYLAIATIAFVEILRVAALNLEITGGAVGIFAIPQPFQTSIEYLWLALPLLLLSALFVFRLERIRVGRAFTAIREDELAAAAMGINPTYYKVLSFTLGAILAGMTGAISAHFLNTWNARQGTFDASIIYLAFVIIGGSRNFLGPVVGGMVLTALPELLRQMAGIGGIPTWLEQFLHDGRLIIFGVLIVIGSIFYPQGIIPASWFKKRGKVKISTQSHATNHK